MLNALYQYAVEQQLALPVASPPSISTVVFPKRIK